MNVIRNVALIIALFLASCNNNSEGYNDSTFRQKLLDLTSQYNKVWETLNVEKIAEYHSNERFIYYWHGDLASESNDHFRKLFPEILSATKAWSMKTSNPLVQIINKDAGVISFTFEAEVTGLDGAKMNEIGALTYVWNNINGQWKIVHIHESPKVEIK